MRKLVLVALVGTLLGILFGDKVPATLVRALGVVVWGAGALVALALLVMTWRHRQFRRTLLPIAGCFGAIAVTHTAAADRHLRGGLRLLCECHWIRCGRTRSPTDEMTS